LPTPIIANVAEVVVKQRLFGQDVLNVWHVQVGAAPTAPELLAVAADFQAGYADIYAALSQELAMTEIFVRNMGSISGPEATLSVIPEQLGTIATASMPGGTALCVSLRTALSGRRFRGRKYFSGIPNNEVAGNQFNAPFVSSVLSGVQSLIGTLSASGTPLQVVSLTGLTSVPVTAAVAADLDVDSQRRRLTGRGS
jgi:hypothetical protein